MDDAAALLLRRGCELGGLGMRSGVASQHVPNDESRLHAGRPEGVWHARHGGETFSLDIFLFYYSTSTRRRVGHPLGARSGQQE